MNICYYELMNIWSSVSIVNYEHVIADWAATSSPATILFHRMEGQTKE